MHGKWNVCKYKVWIPNSKTFIWAVWLNFLLSFILFSPAWINDPHYVSVGAGLALSVYRLDYGLDGSALVLAQPPLQRLPGYFPDNEAAGAWRWLHLGLRLRLSGAIPLLLPCSFIVCTGQIWLYATVNENQDTVHCDPQQCWFFNCQHHLLVPDLPVHNQY
jgi:hypothetical protein